MNPPTPETWLPEFVGADDEGTKLKVFEDWVDFGKPERELEVQQQRQVSASADDVPTEFAYEYSVDSQGEIEF